MKDFFNKNLTKSVLVNRQRVDNYNQVVLPSYLGSYQAESKINTEQHWKAFKSGEYDLAKEEQLITKIRASIGQRGDEADRLIRKLGLLGIENKKSRQNSRFFKSTTNDKSKVLQPIKVELGGKPQETEMSPTKDMFDSRIDSVFSDQASVKLDDSIFNPLNKTVDSQESFDKQRVGTLRSKAFAEKAQEIKKYQAWKSARDAKLAEYARKKADWERQLCFENRCKYLGRLGKNTLPIQDRFL